MLTAFLDDDPPLEDLAAAAAFPNLIVIPFLIGGGSHATDDIPRRLGTREQAPRVIVDRAIGTYPGLVEIIIDLARRHPPPPAPRFRPRLVSSNPSKPGTVDLVGAGPGDPGLITTRGLELLRSADVVVHDRLIGSGLLGEAQGHALLIDVGKRPGHAPCSQEEINGILIEHARRGQAVVRLKGGDPFVFGRGSEEVAACENAGVPVRVVPGISSALAAPAAAGIPVTARGIARSFTVLAGQTSGDQPDSPEPSALPGSSALSADTLVLLMGRSNLGALAARLIADGRDPSTPAACIQAATTPEQRVTRATLATIAEAADRDGLESPVVTVIGAVAALGGAHGSTSNTRTSPEVSFTPPMTRPLKSAHSVARPSN